MACAYRDDHAKLFRRLDQLIKEHLKEAGILDKTCNHTPAAECRGVAQGVKLAVLLMDEHCPSLVVFVNSILGKKHKRRKAA